MYFSLHIKNSPVLSVYAFCWALNLESNEWYRGIPFKTCEEAEQIWKWNFSSIQMIGNISWPFHNACELCTMYHSSYFQNLEIHTTFRHKTSTYTNINLHYRVPHIQELKTVIKLISNNEITYKHPYSTGIQTDMCTKTKRPHMTTHWREDEHDKLQYHVEIKI
jgi:hypothetical protein